MRPTRSFEMRNVTAALLALLVGTAAPALASEGSQFDARIGKYAKLTAGADRGYCVCQDGTSNNSRAGYLVRLPYDLLNGTSFLKVSCLMPRFYNADGALESEQYCFTFEVLSK